MPAEELVNPVPPLFFRRCPIMAIFHTKWGFSRSAYPRILPQPMAPRGNFIAAFSLLLCYSIFEKENN